jgi:hypothetical protein
MVGKDLNQIMRETGEPTYYTPVAVYEHLLDKSGRLAVINPPYARRMVTQRDMMRRTAKNLIALLKKYDVKAETDFAIKPIQETLRMCWYVPKMMEMGYTECIYIDITDEWVGGFFIVTDTCEVVTASNIMIIDAIESLFCWKGIRDDNYGAYYQFKWHGPQEYEDSETGIIATEVTQLARAMELVTKPN